MKLTPYDTGERLEPKPWINPVSIDNSRTQEDYGKVDFDAEDDYTVATLHIEKQGDGYALKGYSNEPLRIEIEDQSVEGQPLFFQPSEALQSKVKEVIARLDTPLERDEAEVFYQDGRALILVPGEKGYRKQQAILVKEPGTEGSGLGWRSDRDYSGIDSAIVKSWSSGLQRTRD
jgi:hypothetical protein